MKKNFLLTVIIAVLTVIIVFSCTSQFGESTSKTETRLLLKHSKRRTATLEEVQN